MAIKAGGSWKAAKTNKPKLPLCTNTQVTGYVQPFLFINMKECAPVESSLRAPEYVTPSWESLETHVYSIQCCTVQTLKGRCGAKLPSLPISYSPHAVDMDLCRGSQE